MEKRLRVCFILEGSYPYITGGVSSWVHDMIKGLPEVDFVLFSISPETEQTLKYELPENVVEHKDILLSEKKKNTAKISKKKRVLKLILKMHQSFRSKSRVDINEMIDNMPEGYYAYDDSVNSSIGWEMIGSSNRKNNPMYSFSDYFWAWRSSHNMIFTILGSTPPEADIYHAVSTGYAGLIGIVAKLRYKKKFLLTEHGLYHKEREMELRKATFIRGYQRDMWIKIYNGLSRLAYQYCDVSTSLFEHNRQISMELGAREDASLVIPNGIDIERYSAVTRENREGFHVGLVGRVVPIKDIKTFITMAKIVYTKHPDAVFHCIGPTDEDPAYYEDCKRLVDNFNLKDVFHFTGRQNVLDYYSFLDVMLLTSVREAQPLVILEGWSAGVPCVSTKVGNVPEMLDYDEHYLASSKDAEKLAWCVNYVKNNPEEVAAQMIKNKEKMYRLYDKNDLYKTYRNLYKELMET
ncbi:MAG: GT4 family glycosyltransferase PelF [Spirochaetaceae bacterium]|nr:GT4 family glycosyltransferase PelF [Spirochaetaceae bacterium]